MQKWYVKEHWLIFMTITCYKLAIYCCRKHVFKEKINMIHLNLAIALLCGLIVFVSGIETAIGNEVKFLYVKQFYLHVPQVGCILITSILHYFFLAVFLGQSVKGLLFMCCL